MKCIWSLLFVYYRIYSQDSKTSDTVEKDDDHSPTTGSDMEDGEQSTPKNHEFTPETLHSEDVLAGKASKTDIMPDSRSLQKKFKVKNC